MKTSRTFAIATGIGKRWNSELCLSSKSKGFDWGIAMSKDGKADLLATWRRMLQEPELYLDPEELYDILIGMANTLERERVISTEEWLQLVRDASTLLVDS
ncbi:hypothetical protein [Pseudomonas palleroniana]|nr:hypothetical protein [Pseudomonas palleroniana]UOP10866.1 hypothetical protein LDL65_28020 [Pseudomonas palleroniana]